MSDDQLVIQDGDDLSKPPVDLNDFHAWFRRGRPDLAFEALLNQVAVMVGNEQTARLLIKQLRAEQEQRDNRQAGRLEEIVFGFRGALKEFRGDLQTQIDARFDAYGNEIDALRTLVEVRTAPFSELPDEILIINDRLRVIEERAPGPEWEAAFNRALDERLRSLTIKLTIAMLIISILVHGALFFR